MIGQSKGTALVAKRVELASRQNGDGKLVVSMAFAADRYVTEIQYATASLVLPLLRSIEGTAIESWPANGPLQEVVPQTGDEGDFLAGVGRAGKSHWSTIISASDKQSSIQFDFACRAKTFPDWLGSTYQILVDSPDRSEANLTHLDVPIPDCEGVLRCRPMGETRLALQGEGQLSFIAKSEDLPLPRTERWKYRVELC